jgi:hypothetical protein
MAEQFKAGATVKVKGDSGDWFGSVSRSDRTSVLVRALETRPKSKIKKGTAHLVPRWQVSHRDATVVKNAIARTRKRKRRGFFARLFGL